jgi:hypothetical protein
MSVAGSDGKERWRTPRDDQQCAQYGRPSRLGNLSCYGWDFHHLVDTPRCSSEQRVCSFRAHFASNLRAVDRYVRDAVGAGQ